MSKAGPGRPSNLFKIRMTYLADRFQAAIDANRIVDNPNHKHFMDAGKFCVEQAHGKPSQSVDVEARLTLVVDL